MNYTKIHDIIIDRARSRTQPLCYTETHHVIPKSMGGNNCKSNLVVLTAREHYIVHWLLFKIHKNKEMAFAWYRMTHSNSCLHRHVSHTFEYARKARNKYVSSLFAGKQLSDEHKKKLSSAKKGKTYADFGRGRSALKGRKLSEAHKIKLSNAGTGHKHSEETKRKLRDLKSGDKNPMFGNTPSPETRKKLSNALKGKKNALGVKRNKETREKLSKAFMGRIVTEETKRKISESAKESWKLRRITHSD